MGDVKVDDSYKGTHQKRRTLAHEMELAGTILLALMQCRQENPTGTLIT